MKTYPKDYAKMLEALLKNNEQLLSMQSQLDYLKSVNKVITDHLKIILNDSYICN